MPWFSPSKDNANFKDFIIKTAYFPHICCCHLLQFSILNTDSSVKFVDPSWSYESTKKNVIFQERRNTFESKWKQKFYSNVNQHRIYSALAEKKYPKRDTF